MNKNIDLVAYVEAVRKRAEQRPKQEEREPLPSLPVQLPLWPDAVRAVPNVALRSALFGAIQKGPRRHMDREQISSIEGIDIRYTGQRLDQGDLDVWETVLHIACLQAMGDQCRFTAYAMLKMLGKTNSGSNRDVLHKQLLRLKANAIEVKIGRFTYIGGLVDEVYKDEVTHEYIVVLNPKLCPLFSADQFTQIEWVVRHALDGKPLAQWLHGFYASHAQPYPIKLETLHKLCGSETVELWKYAQTLRKALDDVSEASNAYGQSFSYEIRGDLVFVEKKPSGSQRRHVSKKTAAKLRNTRS